MIRVLFALLLALAFFGAAPAQAQVSFPQTNNCGTFVSAASGSCSLSAGISTGNFLAACGQFDPAVGGTFSDDKGDTPTAVFGPVHNLPSYNSNFYCVAFLNATAGAKTVTATYTGGNAGYFDMWVWEISGLTNPVVDLVPAGNDGNSAAFSSTSTGTLSSATEAVVGYAAFSNIASTCCGSPFTSDGINGSTGSVGGHYSASATTSVAFSGTNVTGGWGAYIATFKSGSAPPNPSGGTSLTTLLHVGSSAIGGGGGGVVNPNLLLNCSTFNAVTWTLFGSPSNVPTFGSLVADPNGVVDAQQISFTDPRDGFYQVPTPALAPNTVYTATVYHQLISGTPDFYLGYYTGESSVTQYSPKIIPSSSWTHSASFTFTTNGAVTTGNFVSGSAIVTGIPSTANMIAGENLTGNLAPFPSGTTILSIDSASQIHMSANATANATGYNFTASDVAPAIALANANVDSASQGNVGTAAIWGMKLELGSIATTFNGCAAPANSRNFLLAIKTDGNGSGSPSVTYQTFIAVPLIDDGFIGAIGNNWALGSAGSDTAFTSGTPPTSLKVFRAFSLTSSTAFDPNDSSGQCDNAALSSVAGGSFDPNIQAALNQVATDHNVNHYDTVVLRLGWEAGGSAGFCWSSQATDGPHYVAAFRHVCSMIHTTTPFAKIEWNNNLQSDNSGAGGAERSWRAYYPGDDCVDIVSTDLYFSTNGVGGAFLQASTNFAAVLSGAGWSTQPTTGTIPPGTAGLNFMDAFAQRTVCLYCPTGQAGGSKLMSFGELGVGGAGGAGSYTPAPFISQLASWMFARNTRMAYAAWWDGNDSGSTAIESDAAAISAWQNAFNSTTYTGTWAQ
jgi:hypothetical protein